MPREHTCAGCGTVFSGNHRVKGGEPFCPSCEPLAPGRGLPKTNHEPPRTVERFEASKATPVPVGALLGGGDPR